VGRGAHFFTANDITVQVLLDRPDGSLAEHLRAAGLSTLQACARTEIRG
jgi:hypothetical protein